MQGFTIHTTYTCIQMHACCISMYVHVFPWKVMIGKLQEMLFVNVVQSQACDIVKLDSTGCTAPWVWNRCQMMSDVSVRKLWSCASTRARGTGTLCLPGLFHFSPWKAMCSTPSRQLHGRPLTDIGVAMAASGSRPSRLTRLVQADLRPGSSRPPALGASNVAGHLGVPRSREPLYSLITWSWKESGRAENRRWKRCRTKSHICKICKWLWEKKGRFLEVKIVWRGHVATSRIPGFHRLAEHHQRKSLGWKHSPGCPDLPSLSSFAQKATWSSPIFLKRSRFQRIFRRIFQHGCVWK